MVKSLLKYSANKAVYIYIALLICIPLLFGHSMEWYFYLFGIIEVLVFFFYVQKLPFKWQSYTPTLFVKKIFYAALSIRVVYVLFSLWFYNTMTGSPFEFSAADVWFYDEMGRFGHQCINAGELNLLEKFEEYSGVAFSDSGYPFYLSIVYWIFDDSIFLTRIIKCLLSAWTCVLVYHISKRNFGELIARMAAIFCMLMPNLIYYCGLHLKETEMVFLIVLFVERVDFAIRSTNKYWMALITALIVGGILFMFRTALAAVAMIALALTLMLSTKKVLSLSKKNAIGLFVLITMLATIGNEMINEMEQLILNSGDNQSVSMQWRTERKGGNEFAKYAGAAVFAPMIFTIPFPTLVDTPNQENQRMIHGGNYVKNITSAFTIFALFSLLFTGKWRQHVLIIAIGCGYLIVIALSAFAHSERFHLPALPFAMILAAYGITQFNSKHKRWLNYWLIFIFLANIAWAWFKLKGRGL